MASANTKDGLRTTSRYEDGSHDAQYMTTESQLYRQHPLKSTLRSLKTALQMLKMTPKLPRSDGRNLQDSSKMVSKMVPKMSLDGQSNPHDGPATSRQAKLEGAAVIPEGIVN